MKEARETLAENINILRAPNSDPLIREGARIQISSLKDPSQTAVGEVVIPNARNPLDMTPRTIIASEMGFFVAPTEAITKETEVSGYVYRLLKED